MYILYMPVACNKTMYVSYEYHVYYTVENNLISLFLSLVFQTTQYDFFQNSRYFVTSYRNRALQIENYLS